MFHLKEIKNRFRITAAMWNKVVSFLNNICGSKYISISRPDDPAPGSPVVISLDFEKACEDINIAEKPTQTETIKSGFDQTSDPYTKLTDEGYTFGTAGGKGVKCKLCFRGTDNGQEGTLFWRECTITSDGRIYMIGKETDALGVLTDS